MEKWKALSFLEYRTSKYICGTVNVPIWSENKVILEINKGKIIQRNTMERCQEHILQSKYCER